MRNITEPGKLVGIGKNVVQAQQTPFFTSIRSHIAEIHGDTTENVDLFNSDSIYQ